MQVKQKNVISWLRWYNVKGDDIFPQVGFKDLIGTCRFIILKKEIVLLGP